MKNQRNLIVWILSRKTSRNYLIIGCASNKLELMKNQKESKNQRIYIDELLELAKFSVLSSVDIKNTLDFIEMKENKELILELASSDLTKFALFCKYKGQIFQKLMRYNEAEIEYFRAASVLITQKFEPDKKVNENLIETIKLVDKFISLADIDKKKHLVSNKLFEVLLEIGNLKFELCDYTNSKTFYDLCEKLNAQNENKDEQYRIRIDITNSKQWLINVKACPNSDLLKYVDKIKEKLKENYHEGQLKRLGIKDINPQKAKDLLTLGIFQEALGFYKDAIHAFRLSLHVLKTLNTSRYNPELIFVNLYKINILINTGYYQDAIPELKKAIKDCKSSYCSAINFKRNQGMEFQKSRKINENNLMMADCLMRASHLYIKLDLMDEAQKFLESVEPIYVAVLQQYGSDMDNPSVLQERIVNFFLFSAEFYLIINEIPKFNLYKQKATNIVKSIENSKEVFLTDLSCIFQSKLKYLDSLNYINSAGCEAEYEKAEGLIVKAVQNIKVGGDYLEAVRGKEVSTPDSLRFIMSQNKCNLINNKKKQEINNKLAIFYNEKALDSIDEAVKSHKKIFPNNHPDILQLYLMKAELKMKNNPEEASIILDDYLTHSTKLLSGIFKDSSYIENHSLMRKANMVKELIIKYKSEKLDYHEKQIADLIKSL